METIARVSLFLARRPTVTTRPSRPGRLADGALAVGVIALWCVHAFRAIFARLEWYDWVAYALPAANLVNRGVLSTPQLGPQFAFDRTWLFNSPLMGAGPALFFAVLGTGRVAYLVGVAILSLANLFIFAWAFRRALRIESVALAVVCAQVILLHRIYLAHDSNQRYDLLAYGVMLLAFFPATPSTLRWACAGSLPLLHPALIPASVAWLGVELVLRGRAGRSSLRVETPGGHAAPPESRGDRPAWCRLAGPALFALGWLGALAWYGRLEALRAQFLPHLRYHSARAVHESTAGQILLAASALPYSVPTLATTLVIAAGAFAVPWAWCVLRSPARPTIRVTIAALLVAGVVVLDVARGFSYWSFYVLGLAPCLLDALGGSPRPRRIALIVLIGLASAETVVALRLDHAPARLVDQRDAIAFLVEQTRPGDTMVVGPPFVLASAPRVLPGGRRVARVVPQVFYLLDFDRDAYRAEIAGQVTVYIGEPEWFTRATMAGGVGRVSAPLFDAVETRMETFFGRPVIVARKVEPATPGAQSTRPLAAGGE